MLSQRSARPELAPDCTRLYSFDEDPDWHSPVGRVGTKITMKIHNSGANIKR
jgi:hypothetical protein